MGWEHDIHVVHFHFEVHDVGVRCVCECEWVWASLCVWHCSNDNFDMTNVCLLKMENSDIRITPSAIALQSERTLYGMYVWHTLAMCTSFRMRFTHTILHFHLKLLLKYESGRLCDDTIKYRWRAYGAAVRSGGMVHAWARCSSKLNVWSALLAAFVHENDGFTMI